MASVSGDSVGPGTSVLDDAYRLRPVFITLEDSPMFRDKVVQLEGGVDRLEKRCQKLIKGARKYKDGIAELSESQLEYAEYLHEFCTGPDGTGMDEESMLLGAGVLSKFITVFQELGSFNELLKTQVELILVERLQHNWMKGLLAEARDGKAHLDRRLADYDSAQKRYLGHKGFGNKMLGKGDDRVKVQAEMSTAQAAAEEARFELARKLTEVEGRKRYEFLEAMVSSMDGHLRYFKRGYEVLKNLEPYIQQALEMVDALKEEEAAKAGALEDMIYQFRELKSSREAKMADVVSSRNAGPVQMTGNMTVIVNEVEAYIKATVASGGAHVTALKQGYLLKRSSGLRREWKRRFFVLDSAGMLYYYSNKDKKDNKKTPQNTVNLQTSTIKQDSEDERDKHLMFCFRVVSPGKIYLLQAENALERKEWMECIQAVIACLLTSSVDLSSASAGSRRPLATTHMRTASMATDDPWLRNALHPQASGPSYRSDSSYEDGSTPTHRRSNNFGRTTPPNGESVIEQLARVPGNHSCCDCGAPEPDWASLNLGVLLCIECSGIHRRLGVHISKVRSLTLDVKVWERSVLTMFEAIGNAYANSVWEENLRSAAGRPATAAADNWVLLPEDEASSTAVPANSGAAASAPPWPPAASPFAPIAPAPGAPALQGAAPQGNPFPQVATSSHFPQMLPAASPFASPFAPTAAPVALPANSPFAATLVPSPPLGQQSGAAAVTPPEPKGAPQVEEADLKPRSDSPADMKEAYISAKYVQRQYVAPGSLLPGGSAQAALWDAVELGDLRLAVKAVAGGADVNHTYASALTAALVADVNELTDPQQELPEGAGGDVSALHCAVQMGNVPLVEYLLQNGARPDKADAALRTPLHYAVLCGQPEVAKLLLRRGANKEAVDFNGSSALDMTSMVHGAPPDRELIYALSEQPAY